MFSNFKKYSVYVTPNLPTIETKRYKFNVFKLIGIFGLYSMILILIVLAVLTFTPLKKIVLVLEKNRFQEQEARVTVLEDKVVYLSKQLEEMASVNRRLKYSILLGTSDKVDSASSIYDSLKKAKKNNLKLGGDVFYIFNELINKYFSGTTDSIIVFSTPIHGFINQKFLPDKGHLGIDFAAKINTPIYASAGGVVIFSDFTTDYGNSIILDHGNGFLTFYKHCAVLLKKERAIVHQGELIALSGNTGLKSSGPHLHFEIWQNGKPINPEKLLLK